MTNLIPYNELIDGAMRAVVREVLRKAAKSGLPGEHHFYITFRTDFPGVKVSDTLRQRYPNEMTIVLQHQYWDFRVDEQQFQVTLSFSGTPERLVIPYVALTAFTDPSVKFGLQFQPNLDDDDDIDDDEDTPMAFDDAAAESDDDKGGAAEIISLDAFRKK